jgi:hypothetical protein
MSHTFFVATHGLETQVDEVLSLQEFHNRKSEDFTANRHWFTVTVENVQDQEEWVSAYNDYLYACWTPNQTLSEQKNFYGPMRDKAIRIMNQLEVTE